MFQLRVVALIAALAVVGTACGGDDNEEGDEKAFCEVASELTDRNPLSVVGTGNPDQVEAAMQDLSELLGKARSSAPGEVRDDVVTIADALDGVIEALARHNYDVSAASGDLSESALAQPDTQAALTTAGINLQEFATDKCGLGTSTTAESEVTTTVPTND